MTEKILLEAFSKYIKQNNINNSSQNGFPKDRLCLTNPITFCDEVTGEMDEVRPVDAVYLGLIKAFNTLHYNILIDKLLKYGLYKDSEMDQKYDGATGLKEL